MPMACRSVVVVRPSWTLYQQLRFLTVATLNPNFKTQTSGIIIAADSILIFKIHRKKLTNNRRLIPISILDPGVKMVGAGSSLNSSVAGRKILFQ